MALSDNNKKTIDIILPTVAAALAAYYLYRGKKSGKEIAIVAVIAWVLSYIIISQVTRMINRQGPAQKATGGTCDNYDPSGLANRLKEDITCVFCKRDLDIYKEMMALPDCEFITLYNYWNKNIYANLKKTLRVAIEDEGGVNIPFQSLQEAISDRFQRLNLQ